MNSEPLVFIGTSDLAGLCRGKSFPMAELDGRMGRGVGITHSNLMMSVFGPIFSTPFGTAGDLNLVPDPAMRCPMPMVDGSECLLLLGDFRSLEGEPWACCPRNFLRRALADLHAEHFDLLATFEQELVYTGVEECAGSPYTLDALRRQGGFGGAVMAAMRGAGIVPDSFLAEYGARQYEVTAGPVNGIAAADQAVQVRELLRGVATRLGHRAILAPILHPEGIGNGTHIHWSLRSPAGHPVTYDPARPLGLSEPAEHFVAGLLHHMPALTAVTAPSMASYYRLRPNRWAPTSADLGVQDRGSAVRICPVTSAAPDTIAKQFNVEFRVADAAASPYLALGALVHAGVDGLRNRRLLGDTPPAPLPRSLSEALDALEASAEAQSWFGSEFHAVYLQFKRSEIASLAGLDEVEICRRYAEIY